MACDKGSSCSYMILKPEEVGFFDLIHILWSSKVEDRKFIDRPEGIQLEEISFRRRWILFISILVQKILLFVSKPMLWFGSRIEIFLNLLSINRNLGVLLLNIFRGKMEKAPDETSPKFLSFIGNFDKRVELDSTIKYGDPKYFAALSMMASKASYENKAYIQTVVTDHWKMECLGSFDFWNDYQEKATTQAFLLRDKNEEHDTIVVAFRGTEPFDADAWCSDFDISWYELFGVGKIHGGFMKALGLQKNIGWPKQLQPNHTRPADDLAYYAIREMLKGLLSQNAKAKYILTGHSLGGALAILFPAILVLHEEAELLERLEGVYTFGQPRVGDEKFGKFMEMKLKEHSIKYYRFVYGNDMVPRLPYDDKALLFKHFGTCLYYNRHYHGKVVEEEPNKNYFSPLGAIPMMVNAFFELIRSFTIAYKKGPGYKEGCFLRVFRIIGLVMPGISAHSTQDYVNATRLGSSDVFLSHNEPSSIEEVV
ncbi:triacylglycerol lipase OBL1-like [Ziziphus jujuba]|uniref:Triacylglycerol lipase OBL1-like n=1 Tax=Ziziphus jujuba TaxID=326968 RepID=A0A6P4A780_ZIZJJ|nr:triacylglycerol lipase OBL1-like [Ziziphus jujuba]